MARLQILELPEGTSDDRPPFVLVVDQATEQTMISMDRSGARAAAQLVGARAVLVFEETIDIPDNHVRLGWSPIEEDRQAEPASS